MIHSRIGHLFQLVALPSRQKTKTKGNIMTNIPENPKRRLLEAMVTLNALNNGRPVPDMSKIQGGWVTALNPSMSREEIKRNLLEAFKRNGITVHPEPGQNDKGDVS
jgi:hypothetical protein